MGIGIGRVEVIESGKGGGVGKVAAVVKDRMGDPSEGEKLEDAGDTALLLKACA